MSGRTSFRGGQGQGPDGPGAGGGAQPLARSLAGMRATLQATTNAILVIGNDAEVTDCNDRFAAMWSLPAAVIDARDDRAVLDWMQRSFADPAAFRARISSIYAHDPPTLDVLTLLDGRVIERHSSPQVVDGVTVGRVWSFVDITDSARLHSRTGKESTERKLLSTLQKSSADRLQNLSRRLMQAEEEERKRLGRELHDRVGANLSALGMGLELLREQLPEDRDGAIARRIGDLQDILHDTMAHVRGVLADLRPTALDELGLLPALRHQAGVLTSRTGIRFLVAGSEPLPRLAPECEIAFYRIAQEAWANAMKHSGARSVVLTVSQADELVTMLVEDDGKGFEPAELPTGTPSLGLTTMRERAEAIGAVLEVGTALGAGVSVQLSLARPRPD